MSVKLDSGMPDDQVYKIQSQCKKHGAEFRWDKTRLFLCPKAQDTGDRHITQALKWSHLAPTFPTHPLRHTIDHIYQ